MLQLTDIFSYFEKKIVPQHEETTPGLITTNMEMTPTHSVSAPSMWTWCSWHTSGSKVSTGSKISLCSLWSWWALQDHQKELVRWIPRKTDKPKKKLEHFTWSQPYSSKIKSRRCPRNWHGLLSYQKDLC